MIESASPPGARPTASAAAPAAAIEPAPRVVFAGALPPPVTGMTAMTAVIVDALQQRTSTKIYNWSAGKLLRGWRWRLTRIWGFCKTFVSLPFRGRGKGVIFYYPVSSGPGLYYDLALTSLARTLGYRLALHHHVYTYIDRHDWRTTLLDRLVGERGAHVVHCTLMEEHFKAQYKTRSRFLHVPPTIALQPSDSPHAQERWPASRTAFTLGLLSNLTMSKGLDDAIATFERLADAGKPVRLILAGPCRGNRELDLIESAKSRWPDLIEYRGPVYGDQKSKFFADVDAFILPTRSESWGIVLEEALAVGCPVIARARGCVPWIIRGDCGLAVAPPDDFATVATRQITAWMDEPEQFRSARSAAFSRSQELQAAARRDLPAFIEQFLAIAR